MEMYYKMSYQKVNCDWKQFKLLQDKAQIT
jgi:hypothetical protein